jgi:hypothetical protein
MDDREPGPFGCCTVADARFRSMTRVGPTLDLITNDLGLIGLVLNVASALAIAVVTRELTIIPYRHVGARIGAL